MRRALEALPQRLTNFFPHKHILLLRAFLILTLKVQWLESIKAFVKEEYNGFNLRAKKKKKKGSSDIKHLTHYYYKKTVNLIFIRGAPNHLPRGDDDPIGPALSMSTKRGLLTFESPSQTPPFEHHRIISTEVKKRWTNVKSLFSKFQTAVASKSAAEQHFLLIVLSNYFFIVVVDKLTFLFFLDKWISKLFTEQTFFSYKSV